MRKFNSQRAVGVASRALTVVFIGAAVIAGCRPDPVKQAVDAQATPAPQTTASPTASPAATVALQAAASQKDWRTFTAKVGGYSIQMPGQATISTNEVPTDLGPIKASIASVSRNGNTFLVIYADYPDVVLKGDPQKILAGARSGAINRVGGKMISEKKITLNGFPGREFSATAQAGKEKTFIEARLYLVRQRLYQLIVIGRQDAKPSADIKKFLTSFKIQAKK